MAFPTAHGGGEKLKGNSEEGYVGGGKQLLIIQFFLTILSFSLLSIGTGDSQDAIDWVGADRVIWGTGHWGWGRAGDWGKQEGYVTE